ncbi:MAG: cyclic nucleotide-binding domain-containing protein, partial [Lachnospiraceae bacterium]|nr:cyclic nucleotide-binding domain-containing protein [Lachnospiraceae bacterium]
MMLKEIILFRGMEDAEIEAALASLSASERSYEKNTLILHAGDRAESLGIVRSGSVTVESNDMWGNRTILSSVGPGQTFAETYADLACLPLLVDVRANESCRILFLKVGSLNKTGD